MVVLVDAALVDAPRHGNDDRTRARRLLAELLHHDNVLAQRYSDDGPPVGTPSASGPSPTVYPGWATVEQVDRQTWRVTHGDDTRVTKSTVWGEFADFAEHDSLSTAYVDLAPPDAAARRRADALAVQIASQVFDADLFVTERAYLHEVGLGIVRDVTVCGVDDALALIGLYQRANGDYSVSPWLRFNRGLYTWVATRELLPSAWRWFTAALQHEAHSGDEAFGFLAGSLMPRVQRALVARDEIFIALNRPQDNDVRDDALAALDDVAYRLMAGFDILARVAHRTVGVANGGRRAKWQRDAWLDQIADLRPTLADAMRPGTRGAHVLTIVKLLRNTIHGESLRAVHVEAIGKPARSVVAIGRDDGKAITAAMDALGGQRRFGVDTLIPGRVDVDPGLLIDTLFPEVIAVFNELMDLTPVENLPGVALEDDDLKPSEEPNSPFKEEIRFRIRKQYGL